MKKILGCVCAAALVLSVLCVGGLWVSAQARLGDLNGDGELDMRDAFALYATASGDAELTPEQEAVADMNDDGEIDMRDAFSLYQIASGAAEAPDDPFYTDPLPGDNIVDGDWGN